MNHIKTKFIPLFLILLFHGSICLSNPTPEEADGKAVTHQPLLIPIKGDDKIKYTNFPSGTRLDEIRKAAGNTIETLLKNPWKVVQNEVRSPLPGMVTKIFVKDGQQVKTGDALCVVECMKMQFNIRASQDGEVGAIHHALNSLVEPADTLITFVENLDAGIAKEYQRNLLALLLANHPKNPSSHNIQGELPLVEPKEDHQFREVLFAGSPLPLYSTGKSDVKDLLPIVPLALLSPFTPSQGPTPDKGRRGTPTVSVKTNSPSLSLEKVGEITPSLKGKRAAKIDTFFSRAQGKIKRASLQETVLHSYGVSCGISLKCLGVVLILGAYLGMILSRPKSLQAPVKLKPKFFYAAEINTYRSFRNQFAYNINQMPQPLENSFKLSM